MFTEILTFHQVMPEYLDLVSVFGQQSEQRDLRFSSFREQKNLKVQQPNSAIDNLARSGRQYQLCYNLKGVTAKVQDPMNPENNQYSIRQAAFYHQLDVVSGNTLWIVTKGGIDIQQRFKELTGTDARAEDKAFSTVEECFRSSLSAHLLFCHWSTEDWRGYTKWLEYTVEKDVSLSFYVFHENAPANHIHRLRWQSWDLLERAIITTYIPHETFSVCSDGPKRFVS